MTGLDPSELVATTGHGLPDHEAYRLLAVASGQSRQELARGRSVSAEAAAEFASLVSRRRAGVPLQYLEGTVHFGNLELAIDERALVPRPETEQLWELATHLAGAPAVIVDLCTGSGNLALALKDSFPDAAVYGCDSALPALALAEENARRTGLDVTFGAGDLFAALPDSLRGSIDLLVSNPPYVSAAEHPHLPLDVRDHEPIDALVAGPRGTETIERIGAATATWLSASGIAICEIGETQGTAALRAFGGFAAEIRQDLTGRDRFVVARRPGSGSGSEGS